MRKLANFRLADRRCIIANIPGVEPNLHEHCIVMIGGNDCLLKMVCGNTTAQRRTSPVQWETHEIHLTGILDNHAQELERLQRAIRQPEMLELHSRVVFVVPVIW